MAKPLGGRKKHGERGRSAVNAGSRNVLSSSGFSSVTPYTAGNGLFFQESFQTQLRDHFHGPVCPDQRMICRLMQTPVTVPTPSSCDYASEGLPPHPRIRAPRLSAGSGAPGPRKLQTISLVSGKGGIPASYWVGGLQGGLN